MSGVLTSRDVHLAVPLGLDRVVPTPIDNQPTAATLALGTQLLRPDPFVGWIAKLFLVSPPRPRLQRRQAIIVWDRRSSKRRNAPPLINRACAESLFRDGRARSLEDAVLHPVFNPNELGLDAALLEQRLAGNAEYRRRLPCRPQLH